MLKNKIAVITGSANGIGKATAEIFVRETIEGIAIVDYNYEAACKTAEELGAIFSIINQLKSKSNDSRSQLLLALKPHLSEPKQEKVGTAIKILKLLELLPLIKDTGLLKF